MKIREIGVWSKIKLLLNVTTLGIRDNFWPKTEKLKKE
jgi:hypothetical protein